MDGINVYSMMKSIAERGLSNMESRPGDHLNADGLVICGVCGEQRQNIMEFPNPCDDDPNRKSPLIVYCACKCDRDKRELEEAEKRDTEAMERIRSLKRASLMDDKFSDATFERFQSNKYNERNLKLCQRYSAKFGKMIENNQGLLFWGDVGTGKSFAAACIANALLLQRIPVVMTSFVKLLEIIQSGADKESEILSKLNRAKLVIFDDLGAERNTGYALEKVYNIVDGRYRRKLPMILTTNLTIDEMKKESDIRYSRIYDRIFETCYPMQFTGPSWRKKEAFKRINAVEKFLLEDEEDI